jgi:hypothetical protein
MLERQRRFLLLLALLGGLGFSPLLVQHPWVEAFLSHEQLQAQESPPDPRFGVVEAFWDTAAAIEAGVAWERILFQWSQLQPNGPDDWNTLHVPDEWLSWAQAQGREVVGLVKNTPHWATDVDPPLEASVPRGLDLPLDDPANTWAAFVRRVATFYGARGVHRWIIWNEPDIPPGVYGQEWAGSAEEYYRLLKVAYLVIKEVDPEARVHLAGLTFWHDRGWLRRFLAIATADPDGPAHGYFFDVVSLHIYFQTDTVDYIVNEARAALAAYGLNKPVWINETNASPDVDPEWPLVRPRWRVDLREQASFILQAYALGLAAGTERMGVYKFIDVALPPGGEPFGLLRPDHSRRPAYAAFRLVTQFYAGTRSARISRQPLWTQVALDQGGRTTRVLWARTTAPVTLTLPALTAQATLVDQEGNAQTLTSQNGAYVLTLPGARCADEVAGCIIGGPTVLLIEEAPPGDLAAPSTDIATPTAEAGEGEATPTAEDGLALSATATDRPTPPVVTLPPTATFTATPIPTPSPSATSIPSPTSTVPPSATPTKALTPSATPSPMSSSTPSLAITASPIPAAGASSGEGRMSTLAMIASVLLAGLFTLVAGLAGFGLWWTRRSRG